VKSVVHHRSVLLACLAGLTAVCLPLVAGAGAREPVTTIAIDPSEPFHDVLQRPGRLVLEGFPLPGREPARIELAPFEILSRNARLVVVDGSGEHQVDLPNVRLLRGRVTGDPGSRVVLAVHDTQVTGFIRTADREFTVASGVFDRADGGAAEIKVRSREADPDGPDRPFCSADLPLDSTPLPVTGGAVTALGAPGIDPTTLLTAQVAIDATYEWYEHFGDLAAAQSYILSLIAQVSTIYEDEVNVRLEVPFLRVFTTADDPYSDTTSTGTLLDELRAEWNQNQTGVERTVAHLFSTRPSGGAGIAYLNVLCGNSYNPGFSADYGVSTLSAQGGSWEKRLVAHELGHNFSSPHTHCFVPEIDRCATANGCYAGATEATTGTIMSYCSTSLALFHERVENERIRPAAEAAYPACLTLAVPVDAPPAPQNPTLN